jgi:hypothetical protein
VIRTAIQECGLTIHVLPEELIQNRVALTHFLAEQLHNLGQRKGQELEERWETQWHLMAAAEFAKLSENLQNQHAAHSSTWRTR